MAIEEKTIKRGEIIIKEGDIGKTFFQLIEGRAGVYADYDKKEPFRLSILEAGEFFGEMAILEAYPRSATVVAESNCQVLEISENDMEKFFKENPETVLELVKLLGSRVQAMANDYAEAEQLLKEMRESDAGKSKSLFSKIKKHMNTYQVNKNKFTAPSAESMREAFAQIKGRETGEMKTFSKGMIIFKEGKVDNSMYILHDGAVGMYNKYRTREEEKITEVQAITFFGEMGLISEDPRGVSAVAEAGGATVETVHPEDLEQMAKTCPIKAVMILRHLSYKLRCLNVDFIGACKEITETYNKK